MPLKRKGVQRHITAGDQCVNCSLVPTDVAAQVRSIVEDTIIMPVGPIRLIMAYYGPLADAKVVHATHRRLHILCGDCAIHLQYSRYGIATTCMLCVQVVHAGYIRRITRRRGGRGGRALPHNGRVMLTLRTDGISRPLREEKKRSTTELKS